MTFGKHQEMGSGCQENKPVKQSVGTFSSSSPRRGECWKLKQLPMASDLINHAHEAYIQEDKGMDNLQVGEPKSFRLWP